jgi:hypothetical protein
MSKIQTIIWLFIFIIIVFSMDMIFGNTLRETFKGVGVGLAGGRDVTTGTIGAEYIPSTNNINAGFLAAKIPPNYKIKSDDEPLHFSFSF